MISSFFFLGNVQVLVCRLSTTLTTDLDVSSGNPETAVAADVFFVPKDFVASNLCFLGAMDYLWEYIMFFFQTVQQKIKMAWELFHQLPHFVSMSYFSLFGFWQNPLGF